jgi:ATP-dependent RNA helicase DDX21
MSSSKRKLEDSKESSTKKKKNEEEVVIDTVKKEKKTDKGDKKSEKEEKKSKEEKKPTKDSSKEDKKSTDKSKEKSEDSAYNTGKDLSAWRISPENVTALKARGIEFLFPIQEATFDLIYDGKDLVGRARTGTGKTLAFALPVTEKLPKIMGRRAPRCLVLAPTRELAIQIQNEFTTIGKHLKSVCVYGGVPYWEQKDALNSERSVG